MAPENCRGRDARQNGGVRASAPDGSLKRLLLRASRQITRVLLGEGRCCVDPAVTGGRVEVVHGDRWLAAKACQVVDDDYDTVRVDDMGVERIVQIGHRCSPAYLEFDLLVALVELVTLSQV